MAKIEIQFSAENEDWLPSKGKKRKSKVADSRRTEIRHEVIVRKVVARFSGER